MRILSRILCVLAALSATTLALAGTPNPMSAPSNATQGTVVTYGSQPNVAASGNPAIGTSGNALCPVNGSCTHSGTDNFTGTVQVGGHTQVFPLGHILGDSDTQVITGKVIDCAQNTCTNLNPSGSAGGDLSSSYPNPVVSKINGQSPATVATSGQYSDLIGKPTSLPPSGAAGGDLAGSFPSPTVSKINGANPAAVATSGAYSDLSGKPTALPPNGSASGDLTGTYPSPSVGKVNGVVFGAAPSNNTVPVVDTTNHTVYEQVPNAAIANPCITITGQNTCLGGTVTVACANLTNAGDACLKNTGTTSGTLAAGDDSRITGAVQKSQNLGDIPVPSTARANISAAQSGANADITSLAAITTPVSKSQGGTGNTTGQPSGTAGGDLSGTYPNPTTGRVNGVNYPSAPSTNTVPIVTGSGQITYEAVPNSALANSSITIGGQPTALGGSTSNQGTGAKLQLSTGSPASGNLTKFDATGNTVDSGSTIGTSGATVPLNNANNTTSGNNTHNGAETFANIAQAQIFAWQRDNPPGSPFASICGDLVSAEARPGNATLVVTLPAPSPNSSCRVELHPFAGEIDVDPNGGYIKTDDFDRLATLLKIQGSNGKPSFVLKYAPGGWGWTTEALAPPSALWRYNLSNGQVFFDHDAANSRVRLCPLNGGGLLSGPQMTYISVNCVFAPDTIFPSPNTTYPVYAYRDQNLVVTASAGTGCPDSGKLCLTFAGGGLGGFATGSPITCVNFGLNSTGTPLGNVIDDPNLVYVDSMHLELSDVNFIATEANYGSAQYPSCAGTVINTHGGTVVLDPVNAILVNSNLSYYTFIGNVTTNSSGAVSFVTSQYNAAQTLIPTTVAGLPSTKTGLQQLTNEGGGPAVAFGDGTNFRRIGDGQVVTSNVGARGLLALFPTRASEQLQAQIETTYQKLKDTGLIVSGTCSAHCLTGLWVFALPNQSDTLTNWVNPGTCDMTLVGTPTFTPNQGYTGDGTSALLATGCLESTLGGMQDDFAAGAFVSTPSASVAGIIGQNGTAAGRRIYLTSAPSGLLTANLNANASNTFTPPRYTGMFTILRDPGAAGTLTTAVDETANNISRASSNLPVSFLSFLGTNDSSGPEFSTAKLAFAYTGHLGASDLAHLRAALADYFLVQVGAVTPTVANLPPSADFKGQTYFVPDLGGGAGLIQSDGPKWGRAGVDGYETQALATGSQTLTYLTNGVYQNFTATLTANVTVTLSPTDAKGSTVKKGSRFVIRNSGVGAFTFAIANGGVGGGTLITFGSATAKEAECVFDGTNWQLMRDTGI